MPKLEQTKSPFISRLVGNFSTEIVRSGSYASREIQSLYDNYFWMDISDWIGNYDK